MKHIYVTVFLGDFETDLKIPADMNTTTLFSVLSKVYEQNIPVTARIQAEPLGRVLDNNKTFAEQGVENGAALTVVA